MAADIVDMLTSMQAKSDQMMFELEENGYEVRKSKESKNIK